MLEQTLTEEEIRVALGSNSKHNFISNTVFPIPNVAIVGRITQKPLTMFESVFLIWKSPNGNIQRRNIKDTRDTREYINIRKVWIEENFLHICLTTWGERTEPWEIIVKYSVYCFN